MKNVKKDIFQKLIFKIQKIYMMFKTICHSLLERMNIEKVEKLVANLHNKNECYSHKKFKTSIKSGISFEKSAQSHYV